MSPNCRHHIIGTLLTLAGGIIGRCGEGPTQPAAPTTLVLTVQPTSATAGVALAAAVQVAIQDGSGRTVTNTQRAPDIRSNQVSGSTSLAS